MLPIISILEKDKKRLKNSEPVFVRQVSYLFWAPRPPPTPRRKEMPKNSSGGAGGLGLLLRQRSPALRGPRRIRGAVDRSRQVRAFAGSGGLEPGVSFSQLEKMGFSCRVASPLFPGFVKASGVTGLVIQSGLMLTCFRPCPSELNVRLVQSPSIGLTEVGYFTECYPGCPNMTGECHLSLAGCGCFFGGTGGPLESHTFETNPLLWVVFSFVFFFLGGGAPLEMQAAKAPRTRCILDLDRAEFIHPDEGELVAPSDVAGCRPCQQPRGSGGF